MEAIQAWTEAWRIKVDENKSTLTSFTTRNIFEGNWDKEDGLVTCVKLKIKFKQ